MKGGEGLRSFKDYMKIKNTVDANELYFYGEIVDDSWEKWNDLDSCPADILSYIEQIDQNKPLNIYINSGGGSVFAGLSMYNSLKRLSCTKNVYVDGLAGSIASIIAMVGDNIYIPSNAYLMIHKPSGGAYGDANELRKMADTLDRVQEGLLNVYKENLKDDVDISTIEEMVNNETWLTGEQAEQYFNINCVDAIDMVAKVKPNMGNYDKLPSDLRDSIQDQLERQRVAEQKEKEMEMELELIGCML